MPPPRLTVRRLMVAVLVAALALGAVAFLKRDATARRVELLRIELPAHEPKAAHKPKDVR
jgi:hypothetical protein